MMNKCHVYIAFHRNGKMISGDSLYIPLQVGKMVSRLELEMEHDASGENISDKNEIYSELTGWFWIWKNRKHDIVGTGHYRRYFTTAPPSVFRRAGKNMLFLIGLKKKRHGLFYVKNTQRCKNKILTLEQTENLLQQFDAILPRKKQFPYSVYEQYKRRHNEMDILITRKIVQDLHPDYLAAFDETFRSNGIYAFNMFILPWNLFVEYMNWLFSILFELEKKAKIDRNDKYQKRVCAFMAERLQTVWFNNYKLNVKELDILYFKSIKTKHF